MALKNPYSIGLFDYRRYCNPIRSSPLHHSRFVPRKRYDKVELLGFVSMGNEFAGDEVMQMFVKDRQINGDFVSKIYDSLWRKDDLRFADKEVIVGKEHIQQNYLELECGEIEIDDGFLKLSKTMEGVSSENIAPINKKFATEELEGGEIEIDDGLLKLSKTMEGVSSENIAPINKKFATEKRKDDGEKRKKVNNLKYEVLKGELLLLTVGIGAACAAYCLISVSTEAAISYSVGVLSSCLYVQLLCTYTDNLSKESIPRIFIQKKAKKIGIRSEDLVNTLEKTLNGTSMALSSPRLVIPAAIYGIWALSHQYFNIFDFQLVPAMLGFFAYKAAALVQVYRDNEDLGIEFPDPEDNSKQQ